MNTQGVSLNLSPEEMVMMQRMLESQSSDVVNSINWGVLSLMLGIFLILIIWSTVWKALALWRAGRDGAKWWFVALFLINTLGILEIIYLFAFSSKRINRKDRVKEIKEVKEEISAPNQNTENN